MLYIRIAFLAVAVVATTSAHSSHVPWFIMSDDNGRLHTALLIDVPTPRSKDIPRDVTMLLYTRANEGRGPYRLQVDACNIKKSGYNPSHPTKILIHGFGSNGNGDIVIKNKHAYLKKGEYNVIGVDWGVLCKKPLYRRATINAEPVGKHLARLINLLVSKGGAKLKDIHIIGHSLGAHVAGFAGSYTTGGKVGRITGLDAAGPLFNNVAASGRLDSSDADLVDGIHTSTRFLGYRQPYAHVDFYANGGTVPQPRCVDLLVGTCSHSKAVEYFTTSIEKADIYKAKKCDTLKEAEAGECPTEFSAIMGDSVKFRSPGIYYSRTTHKRSARKWRNTKRLQVLARWRRL